jgi:predicted alpha/beta-fold hydrolase
VLIIHARDDPFLPPAAIPTDAELSHAVTLELSRYGGHVGFVGGNTPLAADYWLERRICEHLQAYLE